MNVVTLAVAGSRKTQSIADACASGPRGVRRVAITLTTAGQHELTSRLHGVCPADCVPEVSGWFAFLLRHWVKPYITDVFPDRRISGFSFDGAQEDSAMYRTGAARFMDADGRAYRRYLSKLAYDVAEASNGAVIDRLSRLYEEIYIDEVQDLVGYDLELLKLLLRSSISVRMVGDVRQSLISTNDRDPKNPQYRGLKLATWFRELEQADLVKIEYSNTTYRSIQAIADFADTIFPDSHGFRPTVSLNTGATDHDGLYVVAVEDFPAYHARFAPQCLRDDVRRGVGVEADFQSFGTVKGRTWKRVAIAPTGKVIDFIAKGIALADKSACGLYVAVTRAEQSIAFIVPNPDPVPLPRWLPNMPA